MTRPSKPREGFESSKALATHLRATTRRSFGTAIRAFLGSLCRMSGEERLALEQRKAAWVRRNLPAGADSQVGRVVDHFALAAVAGELAVTWSILPWRPGNAAWAAEVCLKAWLAQRGSIGSGEHARGLAAVLGFLERHGSSRFADRHTQGERVAKACAEAGLLEAVQESGRLRFQKNVKVPGRGTGRFYILTGRGLETFRNRQAEAPEG